MSIGLEEPNPVISDLTLLRVAGLRPQRHVRRGRPQRLEGGRCGRGVAPGGLYPDCGQATSGLPALGFLNVAGAINGASSNGQSSGDMWMSYYEYTRPNVYSNWESVAENYYYFRLNHESTSDNTDRGDDSDQFPYVLCRGFGPQTLVPVAAPFGSASYTPSAGEFGAAFTAAECAQYGVPTAISNLSTSPAPATITYPDPQNAGQMDTLPVPAGSLQMVANVTYTIYVGGTFSMGYPTQQTTKYLSYNYSGTVSTADSGNGNPNVIRQLISWVSSDTSAPQLLNLPYAGGICTPLQLGAVNITGSLLGAGGTAVSQTLAVVSNAVSPHTLTSISISPRNQIYGATNAQPAKGSYPYCCTAFYADGTIESQAAYVTWTVPANPANAQMVVNGTGASLEMNQPSQVSPVAYTGHIPGNDG